MIYFTSDATELLVNVKSISHVTITEEDRDLYSKSEMGYGHIPVPYRLASQQRSLSLRICGPLVTAVLGQQHDLDPDLTQT